MSTELRTLVREIADDHPQADPREIARHVAKLTPECEVRAFYTEALIPVVREQLRGERNAALTNAVGSPKIAERRDWWQKMLASRAHVGDSQWKLLGDCTAVDLRFCIAEREAEITGIQAQAGLYQRLIDALAEHRVAKVADLPHAAVQA